VVEEGLISDLKPDVEDENAGDADAATRTSSSTSSSSTAGTNIFTVEKMQLIVIAFLCTLLGYCSALFLYLAATCATAETFLGASESKNGPGNRRRRSPSEEDTSEETSTSSDEETVTTSITTAQLRQRRPCSPAAVTAAAATKSCLTPTHSHKLKSANVHFSPDHDDTESTTDGQISETFRPSSTTTSNYTSTNTLTMQQSASGNRLELLGAADNLSAAEDDDDDVEDVVSANALALRIQLQLQKNASPPQVEDRETKCVTESSNMLSTM
jgi:hypothetical protein